MNKDLLDLSQTAKLMGITYNALHLRITQGSKNIPAFYTELEDTGQKLWEVGEVLLWKKGSLEYKLGYAAKRLNKIESDFDSFKRLVLKSIDVGGLPGSSELEEYLDSLLLESGKVSKGLQRCEMLVLKIKAAICEEKTCLHVLGE